MKSKKQKKLYEFLNGKDFNKFDEDRFFGGELMDEAKNIHRDLLWFEHGDLGEI
ncbi:MAG: hypothetical protein ACLFPQ_02645 [Candidatus Woesearchaeota archaeon]